MIAFILDKVKLLVLFSLIVAQACATVPEKKLVENGLTLKYVPALDIEAVRLQHPIQISEAEVRAHLKSFWYEETALLKRRGQVFSESDVAKISRLLTKALNQVKPDKLVRLELATTKADTTSVEVFADKDRVHWRFQKIKGLDFVCGQSDCERINWRILPVAGQRYFPVQTHLLGRVSVENWIIKDLQASK